MKRLVKSVGRSFFNDAPTSRAIVVERYAIDRTRKFWLLDLIPFGAVRMTRSDLWKTNPHHADPRKRQRPQVAKYFEFRNKIAIEAKRVGFELGKTLEAVYFVPMPNNWSNKKKEEMVGMPCLSTPDTDNITKAIKDALLKNDSHVWWEKAEKRWAYTGAILIYATE